MTTYTDSSASYDTPISLQRRLDDTLEKITEQDATIIHHVFNTAISLNAIEVSYELGTLIATFNSMNDVETFDDYLMTIDEVETSELIAYDDVEHIFDVIVNFNPQDTVDTVLSYVANDSLDEVKRQIKVNSKGVKRIKMKCGKGFKWDGSACVKITGAELAVSRIAKRKALITKRSQGNALKIRTLRKTRRARRFRKSMGLK